MGFLARLFLGDGGLPADLRAELEAEGVVKIEESLSGSVTYRRYRAPGTRSSYRKVGTVFALAITRRRVVVLDGGERWVDVAWNDPHASALRVTVDAVGLRLAFRAEAFHDDRSGDVELFLRTPDADLLAALLAPLRAG